MLRVLQSLFNSSHPGSCAPDAAFVTLVANESYVQGALCLRQSLARVGSACPLVLVVADPLPAEAMSALEAGFNASHLVSLSALRQRLDRYEQRQLARRVRADEQKQLVGRRLSVSRQLSQAAAGAPLRNTRQLTRAGGWARRTHQKLLLFALRGYRKAAFLDLDMLIVRNIDAILEQPAFSAVAALPYTRTSFNSGVFVFEPSLAVASSLAALSRATDTGVGGKPAAVRIRGAMEQRGTSHLSDQSVLNHFFKGRWRPLPYGYNAGKKIYMAKRELWKQMQVGAIHFVGRPKPWDVPYNPTSPPAAQLRSRLDATPLYNKWHEQCPQVAQTG